MDTSTSELSINFQKYFWKKSDFYSPISTNVTWPRGRVPEESRVHDCCQKRSKVTNQAFVLGKKYLKSCHLGEINFNRAMFYTSMVHKRR